MIVLGHDIKGAPQWVCATMDEYPNLLEHRIERTEFVYLFVPNGSDAATFLRNSGLPVFCILHVDNADKLLDLHKQ